MVAGLAAALLAVNAQAALPGAAPTLTERGVGCSAAAAGEVCANLFAGGGPMAPGGPAEVRTAVLTLNGGSASTTVGLYFQGFASRGPASDRICSATDPASKFDFTVTAGGRVLYEGTLADFAATHLSPPTELLIPGRSDRWARGETMPVTLAVKLDRSADNSYMGCASDTEFVWLAE